MGTREQRAYERGLRYLHRCKICGKVWVTSDSLLDSRYGFTRCCGEESELLCVVHWQRDGGPAGLLE